MSGLERNCVQFLSKVWQPCGGVSMVARVIAVEKNCPRWTNEFESTGSPGSDIHVLEKLALRGLLAKLGAKFFFSIFCRNSGLWISLESHHQREPGLKRLSKI